MKPLKGNFEGVNYTNEIQFFWKFFPGSTVYIYKSYLSINIKKVSL